MEDLQHAEIESQINICGRFCDGFVSNKKRVLVSVTVTISLTNPISTEVIPLFSRLVLILELQKTHYVQCSSHEASSSLVLTEVSELHI